VVIYLVEPNESSDTFYHGSLDNGVSVMTGHNKVKGIVREISEGFIKIYADRSDLSSQDAFIKSPDLQLFLGTIEKIEKRKSFT